VGPAQTPKKILIVDDEPQLLKAFAISLKAKGYTVETAQDGATAWRMLEQDRAIALLVLDLALPDRNGIELLRDLRQTPHLQTLPVIVISGFGEAAQKQVLPYLPEAILQKPFPLAELHALVTEALAKERA
jgi:two-component system KDP operon response regulator KdpE